MDFHQSPYRYGLVDRDRPVGLRLMSRKSAKQTG